MRVGQRKNIRISRKRNMSVACRRNMKVARRRAVVPLLTERLVEPQESRGDIRTRLPPYYLGISLQTFLSSEKK